MPDIIKEKHHLQKRNYARLLKSRSYSFTEQTKTLC